MKQATNKQLISLKETNMLSDIDCRIVKLAVEFLNGLRIRKLSFDNIEYSINSAEKALHLCCQDFAEVTFEINKRFYGR